YARSIDKVLGPAYQGIDATAGMIMFSDGSVYHLNISWALPVTWPGAVYSLEIGMTGTEGVLTIDDTHRDMVLAVSAPHNEAYAPDERRLVDFMANCGGRCATKPSPGSTGSRSAYRRRPPPPPKRTTA